MSDLSVTQRVHDLVEPLLAASGVEVVDVEQLGATLRITVDRPGGIDLDGVSGATLVVSDVLDRHDPVPGRYTLEVSSPGLERPVKWHRHWVRFVGRTITVRLEGLGRVRARIVAVPDQATVVLQPEGGAERMVPLSAVRDARLAAE